ncbi:MAG: PspC domain-containing protein [Bacteroidales bacterium]|nr:PspC domain-containing protein [Bacteroidales bacterium]
MVKVSKVSISGLSFTLEEEADNLLRTYLDNLSAHYKNNPNGSEILEGIESRIAELMIDRGGKNGVVSAATAQEIIDIIGKPEDIYEESSDSASESGKEQSGKRRVFRDPDNKMVGGVCSGLGAYFKLDPIIFRLFFVVFTILGIGATDWIDWDFGPIIPVLTYCILWAIIPLARTTSQKCEMRGVGLSYDSIERQVENRKEYESVKSNGNNLISICFKIFLAFLGLIFFIVGFSGIIALVCAFFGLAIAGLTLPAFLGEIVSSLATIPVWAATTIKILSLMVTFLPFAALLYGGIMLLFNLKAPSWRPGLVIFLIWFASIIALLIIGSTTIPGIWHMDNIVNNSWI